MCDNINTLFNGKEVWWSDPENKTSGAYKVLEIKRNPDNPDDCLYDDTIVIISNGVSEAEVEACELQDLELRRKRIEELVKRITTIAEDDDWSVHNHSENYDNVDLYLSKYSNAGQDFGFYVECETGDADEFVNAVEEFYNDYDTCEEASMWLGPDGHGTNGAPYDLKDIIADMEECKSNVKNLLDLFEEGLRGTKIVKPAKSENYQRQIDEIRRQVIQDIFLSLRSICKCNGTLNVTWLMITGRASDQLPNICLSDKHQYWEALPESIELDEQNDSFLIRFASFNNFSDSINGEWVETQSLIVILNYLETYLQNIK